MNTMWFLSEERNLLICGFNKITKNNGNKELWVKEVDGASRKVAVGEEADRLEEAMIKIVWTNYPEIITNGSGKFATNVNIQDQEVE